MTTPDATSSTPSPRLRWLGYTFLAVSVVAAFFLVAQQIDLVDAPGCGAGSPCAQASASAWGRVPGLDWPVSFLGLAYFIALAFGWSQARSAGGVSPLFRWLVRLGAAASVLFVVVMIAGGYLCWYCLAAHVGNLGFLVVVELSPRAAAGARRALAWGAAAFVVVSLAQLGAWSVAEREVEQALAESTDRIIEATPQERLTAFTGRYRLGPEAAPIRLVVFSDYQCPECRAIEAQLRPLVAQRDDITLSAKHFPFCSDFNAFTHQHGINIHPIACWAARAAEAAGLLYGNDGFWKMHFWLFDHEGSFDDADLRQGMAELGFDYQAFLAAMTGQETLPGVEADI